MQTTDARRTQFEPPSRTTKPLREPMTQEVKARNEKIRQDELENGEYAIKQLPPNYWTAITVGMG